MNGNATFRPEAEYISAHVEHRASRDGSREVFNPLDGARHALTPAQVFLLDSLSRFRSGEAHIRRLLEAGWPAENLPLLSQTFADLLASGLIREKSDFLESLTADQPGATAPAKISVCAWVTSERLPSLLTSISGLIANNRAHGRDPVYQVFDDTPAAGKREETRTQLRRLTGETAARILYCGAEEKSAYRQRLTAAAAARGVPEAAINFALDPAPQGVFGAGANQNLALLGTAGELALVSDDDIEFLPAQWPHRREGVQLFSFHSPNRILPLADPREARAWVRPVNTSMLATHERLLGQPVGDILRAHDPDRINLERITPEFVFRVTSRGGRVLATTTGSYGDSGMDSQRMLLTLRGTPREHLMHSETHYRRASSSHQVVNLAESEVISEGISLISMSVGLDNREPLPPFYPQHRGQDSLFGATLRACFRDGLLGYLPVALFHNPPSARSLPPDRVSSPELNGGRWMMLLVEPYSPPPGENDPRRILRGLGEHLLSLARLQLDDFKSFVKERWQGHVTAVTGHLETLLELHDHQPRFWADDVTAYLTKLQTFSRLEHAPLPPEMRSGAPNGGGWHHSREMAGAFGELLYWWPEIVAAARDLKDADEGPAITP